jgi:hypothetical protein
MIAITIYFEFTNNLSNDTEEEINEMVLDAKTISNSLMSQGYPTDWNNATVQKIGITNGNYRINQTKLESFANIPYAQGRSMFDTRFNYYVQLKTQNGTIIQTNGNNGIGISPNTTTKLVQITRAVVYDSNTTNKSTITRLVIQLW